MRCRQLRGQELGDRHCESFKPKPTSSRADLRGSRCTSKAGFRGLGFGSCRASEEPITPDYAGPQ